MKVAELNKKTRAESGGRDAWLGGGRSVSAGEEWRLKECGMELSDCCDNGLSVAVPEDS